MLAPTPKHGTLDGLIHWLEQKPRDAEYVFFDCKNCLVGQYMQQPREVAEWTPEILAIYHGRDRHHIAAAGPQTYGAALTRAYAARLHLQRHK